jgi:hypothetical protein
MSKEDLSLEVTSEVASFAIVLDHYLLDSGVNIAEKLSNLTLDQITQRILEIGESLKVPLPSGVLFSLAVSLGLYSMLLAEVAFRQSSASPILDS